MGNKLSCSCAPLMRKAYRYEDSPWQTGRRRDGHLLRWVCARMLYIIFRPHWAWCQQALIGEQNISLIQIQSVFPFRLWAEVFHVAASGAGQVKWQQVSEDLVPVNITCIQDSPECIFHITAYNSQVDKILDVRLVQPGESKRALAHGRGRWFTDRLFFTTLLCFWLRFCRNKDRSGVGMFCVLEGPDDEWHVGLELYIADRREAISGMLCE